MSVLEFCFLGQSNIGLGLFQLLLLLGSVFLILLVLVQRGKGGGLTGALGGMGGQSAFGAKAGDAFTKVTVGATLVWITLCMVTIVLFNKPPPKTNTTTKSVIDIARDMENGVAPDAADLETGGVGSSSIGAPVDSEDVRAEEGASEEGASEEGDSEEGDSEEGDSEGTDAEGTDADVPATEKPAATEAVGDAIEKTGDVIKEAVTE